jgi:hypothetical protein
LVKAFELQFFEPSGESAFQDVFFGFLEVDAAAFIDDFPHRLELPGIEREGVGGHGMIRFEVLR